MTSNDRGELASARFFYEELLGGRPVWPSEHRATIGVLWFLFGEALVEAGPAHGESATLLELEVDSPGDTAARCWDAGYTVRVPNNGKPGSLAVIDPFGRRIALVSRRAAFDGAEAG